MLVNARDLFTIIVSVAWEKVNTVQELVKYIVFFVLAVTPGSQVTFNVCIN